MLKKKDYEKLIKHEQIKFLKREFNLSLAEAIEIRTKEVKDLPDEIKEYFK